jgi:adenylosuccinate lyase
MPGRRGAKLIPRYTRKEMGQVWNDANRFQKWLDVELAATETLAEAGLVPKDAAVAIRERAKVDVPRIHEL